MRGFGLRFAFLADGYELKRHPIEIRVVFRLRMVADDQRKITSQLASALPVKEVDQAVVVFRDKNRQPGTVAAECDAPVHAEIVGDRAEGGIELF